MESFCSFRVQRVQFYFLRQLLMCIFPRRAGEHVQRNERYWTRCDAQRNECEWCCRQEFLHTECVSVLYILQIAPSDDLCFRAALNESFLSRFRRFFQYATVFFRFVFSRNNGNVECRKNPCIFPFPFVKPRCYLQGIEVFPYAQ